MSRPLRLAVVGACVLVSARADASNMTHPRTPVQWDTEGGECQLSVQTPCMTLHDRSQGAVLHIDYGIPYEDTEVTPDEVADSRRHQFFGFCRPHHPQDFLPTWITAADVASAEMKGLIEPGDVETTDILENSAAWDGCWYRINPDDQRRPITCEMAEAGIDWDTSTVPAGVYTLNGYTYEPVFNLWVLRPGVVKIHDGDPDAIGPAAAVTTGELTPYRDDVVMIEGCVDALPGTTYTTSWAVVQDGEPEWVEYAADQPLDGDTFAFEFTPPEPLYGESGMIRVDFHDPMGREYTAFMNENIIVINADNPMGCGDEGSFIGGPCADSGDDESGGSGVATGEDDGDSTGMASSDGDSATTAPADDDGGNPTGCGCTSGAAPRAPFAMIALFALLRRRRVA